MMPQVASATSENVRKPALRSASSRFQPIGRASSEAIYNATSWDSTRKLSNISTSAFTLSPIDGDDDGAPGTLAVLPG